MVGATVVDAGAVVDVAVAGGSVVDVVVVGAAVVEVVVVSATVGAGVDRTCSSARPSAGAVVAGATVVVDDAAGSSVAPAGVTPPLPCVMWAVTRAAAAPRFKMATTVTASRRTWARLRRAGTDPTLPVAPPPQSADPRPKVGCSPLTGSLSD